MRSSGAIRVRHARKIVERAGARFEERHELRVVAEAASCQERRHRAPEADEGRRFRDGLGQEPVEARRDHRAMVVGRDGAPLSAPLSVRRQAQRESGRTAARAPDFRRWSHSYQATRIWLALKIDE